MLTKYDNEMKLEFISKSSNEAFARIAMNGQQKPIAIPAILALLVVVVTAAATAARALVAANPQPVLSMSFLSAHFYICRTRF